MLRIEEYFEETNSNKSRSLSYNIAEHFHGMFIPNKGVGTEFLFIALFGYWSSMIVYVGPSPTGCVFYIFLGRANLIYPSPVNFSLIFYCVDLFMTDFFPPFSFPPLHRKWEIFCLPDFSSLLPSQVFFICENKFEVWRAHHYFWVTNKIPGDVYKWMQVFLVLRAWKSLEGINRP